MLHLVSLLSKYLLVLLLLLYTYDSFHVFAYQGKDKLQRHVYARQRFYMFFIHFVGFGLLFLKEYNIQIIGFYLMQVILFATILAIYRFFYEKTSELLLNNMVLLLMVGMVMLTRLNFDHAWKQFLILIAATVVPLFIPLILAKNQGFRNLKYWYYGASIIGLLLVLIIGAVSYGAKLSITLGPVSIQPSEFIKILYVFFLASMLREDVSFTNLAITAVMAGVLVLILVASKDLGSALIFYLAFLMMLYVATGKKQYLFLGIVFLVVASVAGYYLFSHVQTRVIAWINPLSVIDDKGYQICKSLFAIGTGGWFGLGLNQGLPNTIPVVEQDFIFSAIAEELGGVFALCILAVCANCFFMIINVAMGLKEQFYRLVALGLGCVYGVQVILTVGGAIKFIPSTGVTLPFVSYGGSSLMASMLTFAVVQALYIVKSDESEKAK